MEEYELMKDSKYRMYVAAVDKALKNFEYTSEWPDLISALGKLNKVLLNYTKYPIIPRKIKICKRLAQCMHPALPAGVNLKALETYDMIFKSMGTTRLSHELFIYSAGLFPLMSHATMNVRPFLLQIYETHFVPLGERLRPALSGFLNGILPGLEAGSDYFDRTNLLLEKVCEGVGSAWFYTCIWQCIYSNSLVRLPAICFLLQHFNRKLIMEDQLYLLGNDIDLMVSGLCSAVQDTSVLVQRSALDFLLAGFPTHNTHLLYADMVRLVTSSLTTILRRDMSLNRRLYSWLLGSEVNTSLLKTLKHKNVPDIKNIADNYFEIYSYEILIESVKTILRQSCYENVIDIKPYRILISLFDKPQIGSAILDTILYDVFKSMYLTCINQANVQQVNTNKELMHITYRNIYASRNILTKDFLTKHCQDLIKNSNLLFNTLEGHYIWNYLEQIYENAINRCALEYNKPTNLDNHNSEQPTITEICILAKFLLIIVPIESYNNTTSEILPNLFNKIITVMTDNILILNSVQITQSLDLCGQILAKIQPISIGNSSSERTEINETDYTNMFKEKIFCTDEVLDVKYVKSEEPINGRLRIGAMLEKSKSDSKINENVQESNNRERSNSNQMTKEKKKKAKSISKLTDLKKYEEGDAESFKAEQGDSKEIVRTELPAFVKTENRHILSCLESYKHLFVNFISYKIIPDVNVEDTFNKLKHNSEYNETEKELELLLGQCIAVTKTKIKIKNDAKSQSYNIGNFQTCEYKTQEYKEALKLLSNILLEFNSFPNILDDSCPQNDVPSWFKILVVCGCYPQKNDQEIQIICMNTLLELLSLAVIHDFIKTKQLQAKTVIMGILPSCCAKFIEKSTFIIEMMSEILWNFLGLLKNQNHIITCVALLYQIHNMFVNQSCVEQIIGRYLITDNINVEYIKRFTMLWHLGRDLDIKTPFKSRAIKNFDRSLLKILDNLQNCENINFRLLTEAFLIHTLIRNDISRIMNPLFIAFLHPNTARISILNVSIQKSNGKAENLPKDCNELDELNMKKIYAISSINGNVSYHIAESDSKVPPKLKGSLFNKTDKKMSSVDMTVNLIDDLNVEIRKNSDYKNVNCSPSSHSKSNIKLFVNPLNFKECYSDDVYGVYNKFNNNSPDGSQNGSFMSIGDDAYLHSQKSSSNPQLVIELNDDDKRVLDNAKINNASQLFKNDNYILHYLEQIEPISDGVSDVKNVYSKKLIKSHSFEEKNMPDNYEQQGLVHSWSYNLKDTNKDAELEISTTAEDFFKESKIAAAEILNTIFEKACAEVDSKNLNDYKHFEEIANTKLNNKINSQANLYAIHHHMLLYCDIFDSNLVLYMLQTLKNCVLVNPKLFITCLATTSLQLSNSSDLLYLLARHRKSIFGVAFYGDLNVEYLNFYRGFMYLEIIISILLNYARSFYPKTLVVKLTEEEINKNLKIQLICLDLLDLIIKNLVMLVQENKKGFSCYIGDMLTKCKLQKILLHCLLLSVRKSDTEISFAEDILVFNNFQFYTDHGRISEHIEAYQIQVLRLIQSLIILEHHVFSQQATGDLTYNTNIILIPYQQMFLSAIMNALQNQSMKHLHQNWCNMITSCLPYLGENLQQVTLNIVLQLCRNIETIADTYKSADMCFNYVLDYAITQIEALIVISHYCLLDSQQSTQQGTSNIFSSMAYSTPLSIESTASKQSSDHYMESRKSILEHLPTIIISLAKLWEIIFTTKDEFNSLYGNSKIVKQQLLAFLSPISIHHSTNFLAAIAFAWFDRCTKTSNIDKVLNEPNTNQKNLVYLISSIRVIPIDNLVQTIHAVIKQPPTTEGKYSDICLEMAILELFYCYMKNSTGSQLMEAWNSILLLLKECCTLEPPALFIVLAVVHELMIKCCPLSDRKENKDLQDITSRLIDCLSHVCGACLEQTTWLRRNLSVKEQEIYMDNNYKLFKTGNPNDTALAQMYSVQSQLILSDLLAPILDICFGSQDKDKVITILTSLMYNIVPYLRTHTVRNMSSFNACSKLLASLSSYQYTRKAWKKDVFDLLLDNNLFQMEYNSIKYWKIIIDNLMTHDNTTFRDLMARVTLTQSGSLSIFSSREQEYEQRAHLLKRLAFVILCSETDQYYKYMPEIQEQLTNSLRFCVPGIQAQVFLCFRVLLLRMSPTHITSLWPMIISEMLQVFLQIEQEMSIDTEEFSSHIKLLSTLDASWTTNSNNGLHAHGHPHWLQLQLATAKLLDLALLLPATTLPQFQMYRWAFVGDDSTNNINTTSSSFVPHISRIANLMDKKYTDSQIETLPTKQNELLLTMTQITHLKDLHSFFKSLSFCSNRYRTDYRRHFISENVHNKKKYDKDFETMLKKINIVIELDFLEKIQR